MNRTLINSFLCLTLILGTIVGCGGMVDLAEFTPRELFDMGMDKYTNKKYTQAATTFQALVYNYPGASLVDSSQYYLALSYFGAKNYTLAGVEFNRLLINFPASDFSVHAQFMRGVCSFEETPKHYGLDQSSLDAALQQFDDFMVDHPESELIPEAKEFRLVARTRLAKKLYKAGIVYTRIRAYSGAEIYFQRVIDEYTDTEFAPLATFELAEGNFQRRRWDKAQEQFYNFTIIFPEHELAGKSSRRACETAFMGGEAAIKEGDTTLARTRLKRFLDICSEEAKRFEKVNELLEELGAGATSDSLEVHADS